MRYARIFTISKQNKMKNFKIVYKFKESFFNVEIQAANLNSAISLSGIDQNSIRAFGEIPERKKSIFKILINLFF